MKHRRCMYHLCRLTQVVLNWLALVSISEQPMSLVQAKIHWRLYAETLNRTFIQCASMRPPWVRFLFSPRHDIVFEPMWGGSRTPAGVYPQYQPQLVQSHSTHTYSFWLQYQLNQSGTPWWRLNSKRDLLYLWIIAMLHTFQMRKIMTEEKKTNELFVAMCGQSLWTATNCLN